MGFSDMTSKVFHCTNCGLKFRLNLTEAEAETGMIPCPGCAETALEEIQEDADLVMSSSGAACGSLCAQCPSYAECHGTDIEHQKQAR